MSNTLTIGRPTLIDVVVRRSLATDVVAVLGAAALTGVLAQVAVPLWPVPITGQTLAVLLAGGMLGAVRGSLAMVAYAVLGIIGVPWFSDASGGWSVLAGPTGGYIIGFIFAAALTGWLAQLRWDRKFLKGLLAFGVGSAVVFLVGLPWLAVSLSLTFEQTLQSGLYPFIIGGLVKAAIAAGTMSLFWKVGGTNGAKSPRTADETR